MTDTQKMLDAHCNSIANQTIEEWFGSEDCSCKDNDDGETHCHDQCPYEECDCEGPEVRDCLDIKYLIDTHKELSGVILLVSFGGPNIWVDTYLNEVRGYWGFTKSVAHMDPMICEQLTDYYGEFFNA